MNLEGTVKSLPNGTNDDHRFLDWTLFKAIHVVQRRVQVPILGRNNLFQTGLRHWRIQPVGLGGGANGGASNLTYPQIRISPRISATLF